MKRFLRFIFKKYRKTFDGFYVEETVGNVPNDVTIPSIDFLRRAGKGFEKLLLWQMYIAHKNWADQPKRQEFYEGVLFTTRFWHKFVTAYKEEPVKKVEPKIVVEKDPFVGVEEFAKGMKSKV